MDPNLIVIAAGVTFFFIVIVVATLCGWGKVDPKSAQDACKRASCPNPKDEKSDKDKSPPAPTPTPAAAPKRSSGWGWWIVAILVAIIAYHFIAPALRTTAPPPQATAPKKDLQQHMVPCSLRFVGGDGAVERDSLVGVRNGGRGFFATHTLPWRKDAVFHVVVKILQQNTRKIFIKINGQWTKSLVHPGSQNFTAVVFFEAGEVGNPSYFNPTGINNIEVWTLEGAMEISSVSIEMIYWE